VAGGRLISEDAPERPPLRALFVPAEPGERTLVHFHGNAETIADGASLAGALADIGLGVYFVEYPGYGLCHGHAPSERALYDAAENALFHLRDALGVPSDQTVLQGQSLGTGVAAEMSLRGFGSRLVLISPFTSMTAMVRRFAPVLPPGLLVDDRFDTLSKAARVRAPTLVIHGTDDALVPCDMGRRVAAEIPNAELCLAPGAHHNDLFSCDGPRLLQRIAAFAMETP
jgi:alpha-beta hydrolase superfamily lysophospholipase